MGKLRKRQQGTGRRAGRIAAVWCILCVFVLQCFAVVTILPQEVFAAEGDLTIHVFYKNGKEVTKTVGLDKIKRQTPVKEVNLTNGKDEEDNPIPIKAKAISIEQLIELAKISKDDINYIGYNDSEIQPSAFSKVWLVYPGQEYAPDDIYCRIYSDKDENKDWSELEPVTDFVAEIPDKEKGSISISAEKTSLKVGDSSKFTAKVTWADGHKDKKGVKWESKNPSVATVDASGNVKAKKEGSAKIIAVSKEDNSITKAKTVTVTKKPTTTTTTKATTKKHTSNRYRYTTRHTKRHNYNYRRYTRRYTSSYTRPSTSTSNSASTTTQTSASDTALEPAPGMMTVKEVTLTGAQLPQEDPYEDEFAEDESWDEEDEWAEDEEGEEWETASVDFGTGVGSAAVAALACGAGAVGRVRRFRMDMMGPKTKAAKTKTPADPSKPKKNPLSKLTKKK